MTAQDPFEARAIESLRNGDRSAYDYLVSKYTRRVLSIAWGIVRNAADAEELTQEAFVRAYETIGRFRPDQRFGPWIYRIVTNLSLDLLKHRRRVRHEELSASTLSNESSDTRAVANQTSRRIDIAIEGLPAMQRVVARLFLVEGFEHEEIAAMMGLSGGTVRSHLSLARGKLREQLSDLYD